MIVCSAMGKSTNLLLAAGQTAFDEGTVDISELRELHSAACDALISQLEKRNSVMCDLQDDEEKAACMAEFSTLLASVLDMKDAVSGLLDSCEDLLNGISLLREFTPRIKDRLVSYGERCSVRIVAEQLKLMGIQASAVDSWTIGFRTTSQFGNADILDESYDAIKQHFLREAREGGYGTNAKEGQQIVPVITGFIATDGEGQITTLGRGGSDLTAAVLGAACSLDEIQVWKDVDGMLTADPRVVKNAVPVPSVTFEEASELAYFGAKILHPISMLPAMKFNIPVRIKNSYNPSHPGTLISNDHYRTRGEGQDGLVCAITSKSQQILIDVVSTRMLGQYGFLARLFSAFERYRVSIDAIATSEVSVSLTIDGSQAGWEEVVADLDGIAEVEVNKGRSVLTLIADVQRSSNVLEAMFRVLSDKGIQVEMLSQGASKVNISIVVRDEDLDEALAALHDYFFS